MWGKKAIFYSLFFCYLSAIHATTFEQLKGQAECHWDYSEIEEWPTLCGGIWSICGSGTIQSPINLINYQIDPTLTPLVHNYPEQKNAVLVNTGHAVQIQVGNQTHKESMGTLSNPVLPRGSTFNLLQLHFHSPSEHLINDTIYASEVHFVHSSGSNYAVVGIMFELSNIPNPDIQPIIDRVYLIPREFEETPIVFNPSVLIPRSGNYFHYMGSLTAPPCSEGLYWFVYEDRVPISYDQWRKLYDVYHQNTNRPAQNINARTPIRYFKRPISPATYSVQIKNGFSSADMTNKEAPVDSLIYLWAETHTEELFDHWEGSSKDLELLSSNRDYYTTFRMPPRPVKFEAAYRSDQGFGSWTKLSFNDLPLFYSIPKHHSGVIFWFHGDGERPEDYVPTITNSVEKQFFSSNLISNSFGMVIYSACCYSSSPTTISWNPSKLNNTDLNNFEQLYKFLMNSGVISYTDTLIASGLGSGGKFAITVATTFNFQAVISFCALEHFNPNNISTIPRLFLVAANDPNGTPQEIFELVEQLEHISIHAKYYVKQPTPLHPNIFTRIPYISEDLSRHIVNVFVRNGFVDPTTFYFTKNPVTNDSLSNWRYKIPTDVSFDDVLSVVTIAWAGHTLFDDATNGEIVEFLHEYSHGAAGEGWVIAGVLIGAMVMFLIMYGVCVYSARHKHAEQFEQL